MSGPLLLVMPSIGESTVTPYAGSVACFTGEALAKPSFTSEAIAKPGLASETITQPGFTAENITGC